MNRTPKPLVAIVTSAALRQARYLGMQESVLGSETSEALLGEVSSTAFGRGWFDSTSVTPQESSNDLDYSRECVGWRGTGTVKSKQCRSRAGGLMSLCSPKPSCVQAGLISAAIGSQLIQVTAQQGRLIIGWAHPKALQRNDKLPASCMRPATPTPSSSHSWGPGPCPGSSSHHG